MAWLEQRGNSFHLVHRFGKQKLKRSLHTDNQRDAESLLDRVERRLRLIDNGDLAIPADADPMTFLMSDGKLTQPVIVSIGITLAALFQQYVDSLTHGALESNTVYTLKIHLQHIQKLPTIDRSSAAPVRRALYLEQAVANHSDSTTTSLVFMYQLPLADLLSRRIDSRLCLSIGSGRVGSEND